MPTTATGTAYTTTTVDLGAPHGVAHMTVADAMVGQPLRALLYAHGAGGASDQFVTLGQWNGMRDALLDDTEHAWVIVEGSGGSVVGAQNWGNLAARSAYPAYLDHAETVHDITATVLLGRSMGGLVTAYLYAHDTTGRYAGWINNSGVSTLLVGATSGPKDTAAATGWYFTPTMWNSWGVTDVATLSAAMAAADAIPEDWDPPLWAGKNILACYGDADTTVPWTTRGAKPLRDLWVGQPAIDRASLTPGGGHGGTVNSYGDIDSMLTFIGDVFGDIPPEPPTPTIEVVTAAFIIDDGQRYAVAF